jgi:septal ring factor EnvC (AmiA/AmiB activator)
MGIRLYLYIGVALAGLVGEGCQTVTTNPSRAPATAEAGLRDNLYSLLYDLLSDERHVSKLLLIKRESRPLNHLIKRISDEAAQGADQLKEFAKKETSLNLEIKNLPPGERAVRQAIATTKRNELLKSSGRDFERALLLTQMEALNYGAHLAAVAAKKDPAPRRAEYLSNLSRTMNELRSEVFQMLFNERLLLEEPIARHQEPQARE